MRVQEDARGGVAGELGEFLVLIDAIGLIAEDWMAEVLEMHTDLVGAAGVDLRLDVRGVGESFEDAEAGVGGAAFAVGMDGHALAVDGMAGDAGGCLHGGGRGM